MCQYFAGKFPHSKKYSETIVNRLKTYHPLDEIAEKKVIDYLHQIAIDGKVHETVHTTIATMSWCMDE